MPEISVILATRNRALFLEPCLESLCKQTIAPSLYEICVIANDCSDDTPTVVARMAAKYPEHRLFMIEEPLPGLARARNSGLRHTTAPLVANMDDDGTVCPNWLVRFLARFRELGPDIAIVSGEIDPVWGEPKPEWLTPFMCCYLSAGTSLGSQARFVEKDESINEGNSCYRRDFLTAAGMYPVKLGRVGNSMLSSEGAVEAKIRQLGGRVFFDPAIVLHHYIHAERLTHTWLRHRYFWQGISDLVARRYKESLGIEAGEVISLNMPLTPPSWNFAEARSPEKLEENFESFRALGFALAMTGILSVE